LDDVARIALELPGTTEVDQRGGRAWQVAGKTFAWERPFRKADLARFGDAPVPTGAVLGVRVADLGEKEAVLAANPEAFFTIPHFDGYAAILIQLDKVSREALHDALVDGWLARAPRKLADALRR
jgi:hypothetical protein